MKQFIRLLVIFLIPVLVVAGLIEYTLRKIPNDYAYKNKYLETFSNKIEVLFLGNSHIYYGINPMYMKEPSFNASHVAQSLEYDYAILENYKNRWSKLKYIVVPIDYFSLYKKLTKGIENWRVKNYNIYYNIYESKALYNDLEIVHGTFKMNLARIRFFLEKGRSDITCNSLGWGTVYKSVDDKDLNITGKIAVERHTQKEGDDAYLVENIKSIENIIAFAKSLNVKVIFVTCPAYKTYYKNLNKDQLQETMETITKLTSGEREIKYYNLLENNSFVNTDFYDADHLNERGAKKFSLMVDSLIHLN